VRVLLISARNIDNQDMAQPRFLLDPVRGIVAACRAIGNAPIVLGGAGYGIFPEAAVRYLSADFGIQAEGESVFPDLVNRIAASADPCAAPGVWSPGRPPLERSFAANLDDLTLPDPALWIPPAADRQMWIPVQTR
jgi:hypothetical protein